MMINIPEKHISVYYNKYLVKLFGLKNLFITLLEIFNIFWMADVMSTTYRCFNVIVHQWDTASVKNMAH